MRHSVYNFSPRRGLLLSPASARYILGGRSVVPVDLGLGEARVDVAGGVARISGGGVEASIGMSLLERLVRGDKFLFVDSGGAYFVEKRELGHYYKLRYLGEKVPPTLEIDGVHMHNITGVDPWRDAVRKVSLARVKSGHRVLDVCTGLGYTAIASLERGADVVTVEVSKEVLWVAEHNPYSRELVKAKVLLGDAWDVTEYLNEEFDRIIHDPPVFSHAGRLYSREFYEKLYSLLRPGGIMFHYTGAPGRRRGVRFQKGVVKRLRAAGFNVIRVVEDYGVVAKRT